LTALYSALLTHRSFFAFITCRFIWNIAMESLYHCMQSLHNYRVKSCNYRTARDCLL